MDNSKIIIDDPRTSPRPIIHHLIGRMPEFQRKYGLWIINASIGLHAGRNGFERCPARTFEFYSLSHLYDGGGRLWIDGQGERKLNAGSLILITPGTLNRYGGTAELPYVEDSIRFCGPIADGMAEAGILLSGVYELGTVRRLPPIADLASDPGRDAQIRANMLDRKHEQQGSFRLLVEEGVGGIVFSPLNQGMLTDRYLNGVPADSRAARGGFLKPEALTDEVMAKIRALNGIAAGRGQTLAEMAIAWLLGRPGVTSALIGASRPEQIRDVVAGLRNLDFTAEELAGIERILG